MQPVGCGVFSSAPGAGAVTGNPSFREAVGGTEVQGHLGLQSKFPAKLACPRPYLKRETKHTRHTNTPVCSQVIYGHLFVFTG